MCPKDLPACPLMATSHEVLTPPRPASAILLTRGRRRRPQPIRSADRGHCGAPSRRAACAGSHRACAAPDRSSPDRLITEIPPLSEPAQYNPQNCLCSGRRLPWNQGPRGDSAHARRVGTLSRTTRDHGSQRGQRKSSSKHGRAISAANIASKPKICWQVRILMESVSVARTSAVGRLAGQQHAPAKGSHPKPMKSEPGDDP
jgi:hypothetical protein